MFDDIYKGSGCLKCPVDKFGCDAQYRGSRCAALRAKAGCNGDPQTNFERIRAMNDEELASFLLFFVPTTFPNAMYTGISGKYDISAEDAIRNNLDWLNQPAQEG